jgi:hypothetical protein
MIQYVKNFVNDNALIGNSTADDALANSLIDKFVDFIDEQSKPII